MAWIVAPRIWNHLSCIRCLAYDGDEPYIFVCYGYKNATVVCFDSKRLRFGGWPRALASQRPLPHHCSMTKKPFFETRGEGFQPMPVCAGPWDPNSLHGRVVAGLLAFEIERLHGEPDLQPARLTVDLYRLPGFSTVEVTTNRMRDGRRIRVVDAEFISGGVSVGRATCQLLRRSEMPTGRAWTRDNWDAPSPGDIEPPPDTNHALGGMWATRPISGAFSADGPRRLWMSEVRELVGGRDLTPWQRVALAADFCSPFANAGVDGLGFINTDITLYLHRLPETEWIGFEVVNHQSADGVAIGECYLYDEVGPIGSSAVTALAQRR